MKSLDELWNQIEKLSVKEQWELYYRLRDRIHAKKKQADYPEIQDQSDIIKE